MEQTKAVQKLSEFINNYAKGQEFRDGLHDALSVLENIALRRNKNGK